MRTRSETDLDNSLSHGPDPNRNLLIAAPSSGSGKTVVTLGLLRAYRKRKMSILGAKAGPDFIDPGFHELACGQPCNNLDPWAMQDARLVFGLSGKGSSFCLVEGMMGLFDGAADGSGSAAALARLAGIPVMLVVDVARQSHSIAALVRGFRDHDSDVNMAGVVLNKVGSPRHETMLRDALERIDVPVFGAIPRTESLIIPERHLGLVQAREEAGIELLVEKAAEVVEKHCDLDAISEIFTTCDLKSSDVCRLGGLGARVAIARDDAFSFCYPHLLEDWRSQCEAITFFSPLANEAPPYDATAVFLPGGYPELYAGRLAAAANFRSGMYAARENGAVIYGECGGYMVLGKGIVDADGNRHPMVGLLNLETSFEYRKLHLGYRELKSEGFPLGDTLTAHEFHYTSAIQESGKPLFEAKDALGNNLGRQGLREGNVMGSYMHVIDRSR